MRTTYLLFSLLFTASTWAAGQNSSGHKITIEYKVDTVDQLFLGYHFGTKQYILDTLSKNDQGKFIHEGDEPLQQGVYLVIVPPVNNYHELIVPDDQDFAVSIDPKDNTIKVKGSAENKLFQSHVKQMTEFYDRMEKIKKDSPSDTSAMAAIDRERDQYQQNLVDQNPNTITAALVKGNLAIDPPPFTGSESEIQLKRYHWFKDHFFDQVDLSDGRLVRSPVIQPRLDYYFDKLVVPHPDSIILEVDHMIEETKEDSIAFKFTVSHLFNKYGKSDIVGMDAVTVHMIDSYYTTPRVDWIDDKKRRELKRSANKTRPLLLGKTAPDFVGYKRDSTELRLHDIDAEYTVLYFWAWDCGHCKKSMPDMIKFYNEYKSQGVELLAACTKVRDKAAQCWDMVDDKGMDIWINVNDPDLASRFVLTYDITSTPQIYILDKNKKILMKKIGAKKLGEIMDRIMEMDGKADVK